MTQESRPGICQGGFLFRTLSCEFMNPVYVACRVEILATVDAKRQFAEPATSFPEPYGYDPTQIFGEPDDPRLGVPRLTPTRTALVEFPAPPGTVVVRRGDVDTFTPNRLPLTWP